jgi:hypothetical protein
LVILMLFVEEYRLWRSSFCNYMLRSADYGAPPYTIIFWGEQIMELLIMQLFAEECRLWSSSFCNYMLRSADYGAHYVIICWGVQIAPRFAVICWCVQFMEPLIMQLAAASYYFLSP